MAATPREKFDAAVKVIRGLPKDGAFQPSHEMMLKFYGLFKQATEGPNKNPKPGFWDVINKAKWEAWNKLGSMPSEEAMLKYVDELKKIIETMPQTQTVAEFMDTLGSFYEIVDEKPPIPISSSPNRDRMANGSPRTAESMAAKLERAEQSLAQMESVRRQLDLSNADSDTQEEAEQPEETNGVEGRRVTSDQESDGEEFCDTSDNFSQASLEPRLTQSDTAVSTPVQGKTVRFRGISQEADSAPQVSPIRPSYSNPTGVSLPRSWPLTDSLYANPPTPHANDLSAVSSNTSTASRHHSWREEMSTHSVDQQIAFTLSRIEQDLAAMHSRLNFLEKKLNLVPLEKKTSLWSFPELSKKTVAFIVIWPFIAHFIISFLSRRRAST